MTDPFDVLRTHVQSVALLERPNTDVDDLIASITGASAPNIASRSERTERSERSNVIPLRPTGRRRWLVAAGVTTVVVLGGAGVAAYIGSRPTLGTDGVVCRASTGEPSAIVLEPTDDPIGACAQLWLRGDLPDVDESRPSTVVPRLVACVGKSEVLQVLPLPDFGTCADVGMRDADVSGVVIDPVVELQRVLTQSVNLGECLSVTDVESMATDALRKLGIEGWTIEVVDPGIKCAAIAVDPTASRLVVFPYPASPT